MATFITNCDHTRGDYLESYHSDGEYFIVNIKHKSRGQPCSVRLKRKSVKSLIRELQRMVMEAEGQE